MEEGKIIVADAVVVLCGPYHCNYMTITAAGFDSFCSSDNFGFFQSVVDIVGRNTAVMVVGQDYKLEFVISVVAAAAAGTDNVSVVHFAGTIAVTVQYLY